MGRNRLDRTGVVDFEGFSEDLDEGSPQHLIRFLRFREGFEEIGECLDHETHVGRHQCLKIV